MPTIDPSLVPNITPGNIFGAMTGGDQSLNIRWLQSTDPAYYEVLNRPIADVTLRQLILAKAVDGVQLRLGHQFKFPFLVDPVIATGTSMVNVPQGWIWDISVSMPAKWENLRLAKVKRLSGTSSLTSSVHTGTMRLYFTANASGSTTEVAIFMCDYQIDSVLSYQLAKLTVVPTGEQASVLPAGTAPSFSGYVSFRTLPQANVEVNKFFSTVTMVSGSPTTYEVMDSAAGSSSVTGDYDMAVLPHGTGLLVTSANNPIPSVNADQSTWLTNFNYPYDVTANLTSAEGVVMPKGLFKEFSITAPAGDTPTSSSIGSFFPVWVSRIQRTGTGNDLLKFFFSTYNVTDTATNTVPIEFAQLDVPYSTTANKVLSITPIDDLHNATGTVNLFHQHFGRGHVVTSDLWDKATDEVLNFFAAFNVIITSPVVATFSKSSTRLSSFGVCRIPKYVPTIGQSQAMVGTTANRTTPVHPSATNRFVTEADVGLGNAINFEAVSGITPIAGINQTGYTGCSTRRIVRLDINTKDLGSSPSFYNDHVLPRLRILFGRDPVFGDMWYTGTVFMTYNGDTWQS